MGLEFETEVHIIENFETYTMEMKIDLIKAIINDEVYEFIGEDTVYYEPPEYP